MLGFHSTNNRIEDATKRISTSQLKGHQNKPNYTDPRKFLIENTQKVIAEKQRTPREVRSSNRNYFEKDGGPATARQSFTKKKFDLSKREERILAAKKYR